MPFAAHTLTSLETALSGCIKYHDALDDLLVRCGVSPTVLSSCRQREEDRAKAKSASGGRSYVRAPKRYVVQEVLRELGKGGDANDRIVANLITAVCKGQFPDAERDSLDAIESLRSQQKDDRAAKAEAEEARRQEILERERAVGRRREREAAARAAKREGFRIQFLDLWQQSDASARGYALEKFLNEYFDHEGLEPHASFKIIGEQIDGSFLWSSRTHLVEAKWVKDPVAGAEFSSFIYKISGKSADTRGVFISINGYSLEAIRGLNGKGELRFVCIDGAHLMRCFERDKGFSTLLEKLWRHASETGNAYLPVSEIAWG